MKSWFTICEPLPSVIPSLAAAWSSSQASNNTLRTHLLSQLTQFAQANFGECEEQILGLLLRGWDRQMIADEMHLAEQTVRNNVRSKRKLLQQFRADSKQAVVGTINNLEAFFSQYAL